MRILIVDDKEENRYLLEVLLKGNNHDVDVAVNGADALEKLKAGKFDLIISDILMPVMDGFQLCRTVKNDEALRHIPFIIYTATYTSPKDEAFALKLGADRFILKPCEPDTFMTAVREVTAAAGKGGPSAPDVAPEEEILKLYNERLVRKLEQKMLQAEQEVQARQEAEKKLNISNTRLQLALASANIGLWDWDIETGDLWLSPEWKHQIGYKEHEIPDRYEEFEKRLHPEDRERIQAEIDACLQGHRPNYCVEFRLRHKDGSYRWIAAFGRIVSEEKKSKRFMGCHVDITERYLAAEALRASEKRFRALFEYAPDAYYLRDLEGRFIDGNKAAVELIGYPKEELIGKNFMEVSLLPDEDYNKAAAALQRSAQGLPTGPEELTLLRKDEKQVFTEIRTYPLKIDDRDMVLGIARDITERKRMQQQLMQAQKMESVGRLAGGVAHDFNNMLGVIIGHAELALEKTEPSAPFRSHLMEILSAGERSSAVIRQLLAFARKQTIRPQVLDLNETLEGMLRMLRRLIGEDIDLLWKPGRTAMSLKIDPSQIDQILANLCVNARDAISDVGKIIIETDRVSLDKAYCADHAGLVPGDYILLAVSDNGCGMNRETIDSIFEPFFTTKEMGKGTGLGLATVYGIVRQNNGCINVYSELGTGTTFRIYLPYHERTPGEEQQTVAKPIPAGQGETVLIVEDEKAIREMATEMLDHLGYNILSASLPAEALRLAEKQAGGIDLLLADVILPEMTGRELSERISALSPNTKILFMSGYTASVISTRGVLDDGVNFIQKPFSIKDLADSVRTALDGIE